MQVALLSPRKALVSWCLSFEDDFIAKQPLRYCQNTGEKLYFKKRKKDVSIDDDRTVVGQTVKLALSLCVADLGIFFLTSEYTALCEGSPELNRKK